MEGNAGGFERAYIGDSGREHEGEFLCFGPACVMHDPSVGSGKRAIEAAACDRVDGVVKDHGELFPCEWTASARRHRAERIEAEADVRFARRDSPLLDERGEMSAGVLCLRAEIEFECNTSVEVHAR